MDIQSGFFAAAVILVIVALISMRSGIRDIQYARKLTFYRLRRKRISAGWRLFGFALLLIVCAAALPLYGEPIAYEYFPPSPTITLTPSITPMPTITLTPSITFTPSITITPAQSATFTPTTTPFLPLPVLALFQSKVTPDPQVVFSSIQFTTSGTKYPAVSPATVFKNPVGHLWGIYSYDKMSPGVQWTSIWYRDGTQVHLETKAWDGGTGGYGDTDCDGVGCPLDGWQPGNYEVIIFVGEDWQTVGRFIVQGNPLPAPPTGTPTFTPSPTRTPHSTGTP